MKLHTLAFVAPALAGVMERQVQFGPAEAADGLRPGSIVKRECTSNNCVRAVRGDSFPLRTGRADCSAFLQATVTPATSTVFLTTTTSVTDSQTVTVTTTSVSSIGGGGEVGKRQQTVLPSAFPSYASACSNFAKYSSACSCLGITANTITVAAPTTTIVASTTTASFTEVATATATATVPAHFYIKSKTGTLAGNYMSMRYTTDYEYSQYSFLNLDGVKGTTASTFYIDEEGYIRPDAVIPENDVQGGTYWIQHPVWYTYGFAWGKTDATNIGYNLVKCTINSGTLEFTCTSGLEPITFRHCSGDFEGQVLYLHTPSQDNASCDTVTLFVEGP